MFRHPLDEKSYLKLLEPQDAPALFAVVERNRSRLREWLPWLDGNISEKDSRDFIQFCMSKYASNQGFTAGIWHEGRIVGVAGYHPINWGNLIVSIGYWIGAEAEGKGLVTRATRALVDYAFNDLGLNRVEIRCASENHRSQKVAERLGFQLEGVLRQAECLYGRFVDHKVYSMLKSEWQTGKP